MCPIIICQWACHVVSRVVWLIGGLVSGGCRKECRNLRTSGRCNQIQKCDVNGKFVGIYEYGADRIERSISLHVYDRISILFLIIDVLCSIPTFREHFSSSLMGRPKTASKCNVPLNIRSKSEMRRISYLINVVDVWNLNECLVISADCDIIGLDIIE